MIADPRLLLVTYLVTSDWKFSEIVTAFEHDPNELIGALLKVDKLRVIDIQPPARIRKLASWNFSWRKDGPVQDYFLRRVVPEFFAGRFDSPGDELRFVGGVLSKTSMLRLQSAIHRVVGEFEHLAQQDARLPRDKRSRRAPILGLHLFEFSGLANPQQDLSFTRQRHQGCEALKVRLLWSGRRLRQLAPEVGVLECLGMRVLLRRGA